AGTSIPMVSTNVWTCLLNQVGSITVSRWSSPRSPWVVSRRPWQSEPKGHHHVLCVRLLADFVEPGLLSEQVQFDAPYSQVRISHRALTFHYSCSKAMPTESI